MSLRRLSTVEARHQTIRGVIHILFGAEAVAGGFAQLRLWYSNPA
ncbi:MAG: hypothetical protein AAGD40_00500 [Pseudomonadota bacterium]